MLLYFTPHCIHFYLLVVSTNNSLTHRPSSKIEASRQFRACLRAGGAPQPVCPYNLSFLKFDRVYLTYLDSPTSM